LGCRKQEITAYNTPKESPAPPPAKTAPMATPSAAAPIHWTTPSGWQEQPAGGMRVASFTIKKDDQQADVSVIPLGTVAGSDLDNVNRWRGQVGLPPIDGSKLSEGAEQVTIASNPASLYDMAGTDPKTKQPTRILAASAVSNGATWFFKMIGSDTLVEQQKPAFKDFLKSIQSGPAPAADVAPAAPQLGAERATPSAPVAPGAPSSDKPAWDVPKGWQEQAPSSMRLATFQVTGSNGANADVSVIKLGGMAGGMLANVNRWRSQLGLQPLDEAEVQKLVSTHEANGNKVTIVDLNGRSVESGQPARLLAAIVPRPGATWFYKMLGNDELVAQQKAAFIKFVDSARYPNAS
jgi:hypothetical protein